MKYIKKYIWLIVLVIVCLLIFLIYNQNNKNNQNYLALGDGFALGEDSFGKIDYGYADYVKEYLEENNQLNHYMKSFSSKEASIQSLLSDIKTNKKIMEHNKEINLRQALRESNIVTVSIGFNDLLYRLSINNNLSDYQVDRVINDIGNSYDELIDEIKKYYPYTIYVVGYYTGNLSNKILDSAIKKLNDRYQKNNKIVFISIEELFEKNSNYLSNPNSIYPNRMGYEAISRKIIEKLPKSLKNN